ncbi:MAG: DUF4956 domain-containing protein [Clostridia bacterium]|nr:DUF4956 domain-containing protein [Clostridia bacterium]
MIKMVSFVDTIKDSVLDQFAAGTTVGQMLASLGVAFLMGLFILVVYKATFRGVLFSKGFAFSLILLSMVTALVIRTISSNLALSLGMVGALSIVRFRTAIKDPVDTVFMFWAIAAGIMSGAGLYLIGGIASVALGVLYFLVTLIYRKSQMPYLLVIRYDPALTQNIAAAMRKLPRHRIKSRTTTRKGAEVTMELSLKGDEMKLIDNLYKIEGVLDASLISYEGEFGL